jgi:hypothetical protein
MKHSRTVMKTEDKTIQPSSSKKKGESHAERTFTKYIVRAERNVVVINPEAQFIFLDSISLRLALIGT